jgi:hypothetical protein
LVRNVSSVVASVKRNVVTLQTHIKMYILPVCFTGKKRQVHDRKIFHSQKMFM